MTPQTERVRIESENRQLEQRAALNARMAEGEKRNVLQAVINRLVQVKFSLKSIPQANRGFAPKAKQTI
jgi:hypothetical protein